MAVDDKNFSYTATSYLGGELISAEVGWAAVPHPAVTGLTASTCTSAGQWGLPHSLRAALGAQAEGESSCLGITEAGESKREPAVSLKALMRDCHLITSVHNDINQSKARGRAQSQGWRHTLQ